MKETILGIRRKQNSACYERQKYWLGGFVVALAVISHGEGLTDERSLTLVVSL